MRTVSVKEHEVNPLQAEWMRLCRNAYASGKSAVVQDGVTAIRLDLEEDDAASGDAVQVSLHQAGRGSRMLCSGFFDTAGRLVRFVDHLLETEHRCDVADRAPVSERERGEAEDGASSQDAVSAFVRREARASSWLTSTGDSLEADGATVAAWDGRRVRFETPECPAAERERAETVALLVKLELHKQSIRRRLDLLGQATMTG
jgi:hypothetical protein